MSYREASSQRRRPNLKFWAAIVFAFLVFGEVALRFVGAGDFPLYLASADYGYIPAPSQHGRFLRNDWAFNALSMGVAREFDPSAQHAVLLVGDSIVLCGNECRQAEKLGPRLEALTSRPVWPASAGSWGLYNELRYMELHPEVTASVETVVLIVNPGDFDGASIWRNETTHPTTRPASVLWRSVGKALAQFEIWRKLTAPELGPDLLTMSNATLRDMWLRVTAPVAGKMVVLLYPDRKSMDDPASWKMTVETANSIMAGGNARVVDIRQNWSIDLFSDAIHPNKSMGIGRLTEIVAHEMEISNR